MDLSGFSRGELQVFCREHSLYAGGSHAELEARINEAVVEGHEVLVYFPAREDWREGVICRVLRQGKFEVCYYDNHKMCVHSLTGVIFQLVEDDSEGSETASEEEENEESEEDEIEPDLPAAMGWRSGMRLEVEWVVEQGRRNSTVWWPATLGRRVKGATDAEGRQLYYVTYDAAPKYGYAEAERAKVGFIDGERLNDDDGRASRMWRLKGVSDTEGDTFDTEDIVYEEDDYGIDDVTAGMAGLGGGILGGARPASPRKRALIVACSYPGTSAPLPGTLNDANDILALLIDEFDVPDSTENIMVLRDDLDDMLLLPRKRNILKGFAWLMSDLQPGDRLFFYFSGHGGTQEDPTGQEWRGNQTICPCDYQQAGVITDSKIHEMLVQPLPQNTTLHALIDSCHSGTVMNLPYNAVLQTGNFSGWEEEYPGKSWKKTTAGGLAVQFSAAQHDQYASEARMGRGKRRGGATGGEKRGAATYAFIHAIQRHRDYWGSDILYSDLLEAMSAELKKSNFRDQDPQMSCSMQFDLNRPNIKVTI